MSNAVLDQKSHRVSITDVCSKRQVLFTWPCFLVLRSPLIPRKMTIKVGVLEILQASLNSSSHLVHLFKAWSPHPWRPIRPNATETAWTWSWSIWPVCCLSPRRSGVAWTSCRCFASVWATWRPRAASKVGDICIVVGVWHIGVVSASEPLVQTVSVDFWRRKCQSGTCWQPDWNSRSLFWCCPNTHTHTPTQRWYQHGNIDSEVCVCQKDLSEWNWIIFF